MGIRRRTIEEARAYVRGYCDSYRKFNECLKEYEHISEASDGTLSSGYGFTRTSRIIEPNGGG